ncbi:hypothetical protein ACWIUD_06480 [Helicobacter sp. 23-1044]
MRIYRNKCDSQGNLFWGNHFADLVNRHKARTQSPLSLCRFTKNCESTTAITSIVIALTRINCKFIANLKNSSLRDSAFYAESWQSTNFCDSKNDKNNPCEAPKSRPLRGAKNREQGCSSATADFLLEVEKRGSPPKSEKRQLLARRGSGAGGAALLRKDSSESKGQNGESNADSTLQNCDSYNLDSCDLDSSLRSSRNFAQNDEFGVDCHDSLRKSQNDKSSANLSKSTTKDTL